MARRAPQEAHGNVQAAAQIGRKATAAVALEQICTAACADAASSTGKDAVEDAKEEELEPEEDSGPVTPASCHVCNKCKATFVCPDLDGDGKCCKNRWRCNRFYAHCKCESCGPAIEGCITLGFQGKFKRRKRRPLSVSPCLPCSCLKRGTYGHARISRAAVARSCQLEARALLEDAFQANTLPTGKSKAHIQIRADAYEQLGQRIGRTTDVSGNASLL